MHIIMEVIVGLRQKNIQYAEKLDISMAPGGGFLIRLIPDPLT